MAIDAGHSETQQGADVTIEGGSSAASDGGEVRLSSGRGGNDGLGGNIYLTARGGDELSNYGGLFSRSHSRSAAESQEIAFGFEGHRNGDNNLRAAETAGVDDNNAYALRLKRSENGTLISSHVPFQVTALQYSSDERIKKDVVSVDTDDLHHRIRRVEMKEYGYSDEWRSVREVDDPDHRVRGVIAQQLREVFPERVK